MYYSYDYNDNNDDNNSIRIIVFPEFIYIEISITVPIKASPNTPIPNTIHPKIPGEKENKTLIYEVFTKNGEKGSKEIYYKLMGDGFIFPFSLFPCPSSTTNNYSMTGFSLYFPQWSGDTWKI